jgi:hypothetical protein
MALATRNAQMPPSRARQPRPQHPISAAPARAQWRHLCFFCVAGDAVRCGHAFRSLLGCARFAVTGFSVFRNVPGPARFVYRETSSTRPDGPDRPDESDFRLPETVGNTPCMPIARCTGARQASYIDKSVLYRFFFAAVKASRRCARALPTGRRSRVKPKLAPPSAHPRAADSAPKQPKTGAGRPPEHLRHPQ